jgi:predicted naringenin-chalcone synthase
MSVIHGIGRSNPGVPIAQNALLELALRYNAASRAERVRLARIYRGTKVTQRYSVLTGEASTPEEAMGRVHDFYAPPDDHSVDTPTTLKRMQRYERSATPLADRACRDAMRHCDTEPADITHLITVSCTGFSAPGVDLQLVDALGLSPCVSRTHIGFMGCHGALNGLRVADAFARADSNHRVLLCCVELCTLHFQYGSDPQDAVANALFGDGAAAVIVSGEDSGDNNVRIASFRSIKLPDTASLMSWHIGDEGFGMRLDSKVPQRVQQHLRPFLTDWLSPFNLAIDTIGGWIVHPGGPKIVDAVRQSLDLSEDQTAASMNVLREFGNMSSPTVLFITEALRRKNAPKPWVILAFGPGLVVEACLIV